MKIAVNLAEPVYSPFQAPPPFHALAFDVLKAKFADGGTIGIAVNQSHDAFGVSDEFPNPSHVQTRFEALRAVDIDKIIAECVRTDDIQVCHLFRVEHAH